MFDRFLGDGSRWTPEKPREAYRNAGGSGDFEKPDLASARLNAGLRGMGPGSLDPHLTAAGHAGLARWLLDSLGIPAPSPTPAP